MLFALTIWCQFPLTRRDAPSDVRTVLVVTAARHSDRTWCWFLIGRVRKIAKSVCWLRHVCPSVRMGKLRSHWTDFREI